MVKRLCLPFLLSAFCLLPSASAQGQAGPASQPAQSSAPSRIDPKAQELLEKTIQALGAEAFRNFKTLSTRGRAFAISEGSAAGFAPFENDIEFPDKRRFAFGKDPPVILINNGDRGWELDRYGLIRQEPERIRRWQMASRYSLEGLLRRVIREPGVMILASGVDFVDLFPVRVLEIFDTNHIQAKLYLHRSTFLPVRITYRVRNPQTREWDEYAEGYSDYQSVQDIQTPMHLTRYENNERVLEYFLNFSQYNKEYPTGFFQPHR